MKLVTKILGKISLILFLSGTIFAISAMLIIEFVNNKARMDYVMGWLAVFFILLSILMFFAFLTSMIYNRIKTKRIVNI